MTDTPTHDLALARAERDAWRRAKAVLAALRATAAKGG